jgi:hypothetical protein
MIQRAPKGAKLRRGLLIGGLSAAPGIVLLLIVIAIPVTRWLAERSVMVEAETTTFSVVFAGDDTTWRFDKAIECVELPVPDFTRGETGGPCSTRFFDVAGPAPWSRTFAGGNLVRVDLRPDGHVALDLGPVPPANRRSVVVVATADWGTTGALAFDGAVRIGEVPGSGARTYLRSGRFEAREKLPWQSGTDVVKAGEFALGEAVSVWSRSDRDGLCLVPGDRASRRRPCEAVVFGHMTLSGEDYDRLHVMAVSRAGSPELRVSYAGGIEPRVIRPTWIDSVLTNPALLAVALVMSLITSAIPLMLEGYRLARDESDGPERLRTVASASASTGASSDAEAEALDGRQASTPNPNLPKAQSGGGASGAPIA